MRSVQASPTPLRSRFFMPSGPQMQRPLDAQRDSDFLELLSSYRDTGGLARGEEITARVKGDSFLQLARNIANRRVISFVWRDVIWLPYFQFEAMDHAVRPDVQMLIDELAGALDDWEMAQWFVEPNTCLEGASPLTQIATQFSRAHDAARSLRYLHCN